MRPLEQVIMQHKMLTNRMWIIVLNLHFWSTTHYPGTGPVSAGYKGLDGRNQLQFNFSKTEWFWVSGTRFRLDTIFDFCWCCSPLDRVEHNLGVLLDSLLLLKEQRATMGLCTYSSSVPIRSWKEPLIKPSAQGKKTLHLSRQISS